MAENNEKVARGIFYALTRVILFVVAVLVIALGFFTGMNSMNVNVIAKDAFTLRAEYVLTPKTGQEADLPKLFTQDFIMGDPVLISTAYGDYNIASYYQRTDVKAQIIWPWANKAVVHATEEVLDITGTLKDNTEAAPEPTADAAPAGDGQTQVTVKDKNPPVWVSGEYEVTLIKDPDTSSWKVQEMKLIREIQPVIVAPDQEETGSPSIGASAAASTAAATPEQTGGE